MLLPTRGRRRCAYQRAESMETSEWEKRCCVLPSAFITRPIARYGKPNCWALDWTLAKKQIGVYPESNRVWARIESELIRNWIGIEPKFESNQSIVRFSASDWKIICFISRFGAKVNFVNRNYIFIICNDEGWGGVGAGGLVEELATYSSSFFFRTSILVWKLVSMRSSSIDRKRRLPRETESHNSKGHLSTLIQYM